MKKSYWLFLVFPISQILTIWGSYQAIGFIDKRGIAGIIIAPIADILILYLIFRSRKKEETERRLSEIRLLRETEAHQHAIMERNHAEVKKLRDSLSEEFERLKVTVEGNQADLHEQFGHFQKSLDDTRAETYTGNAVVNAVIAAKKKQCEEELGTAMTVEVAIPAITGVQSMHLCSLFSNMIDNAMDAIRELEPTERTLELKAGVKAGNLWIQTQNPTKEAHVKRNRRDGHGYGLKIIRSIANTYHGILRTEYKNGIYLTSVMIELPEIGKAMEA